jgi:hypothetical protein
MRSSRGMESASVEGPFLQLPIHPMDSKTIRLSV